MGSQSCGGHWVPTAEWAQGSAECSPSMAAVQCGRQDGRILRTRTSPQLRAWVSRDSRPLGRTDTLAGREGNGAMVHFLGRVRNSQGGTFDPGPCFV